jgi:hypothetical protein
MKMEECDEKGMYYFWGVIETHRKFWYKSTKERDPLEDQGCNG